jgi:hypothetical protein
LRKCWPSCNSVVVVKIKNPEAGASGFFICIDEFVVVFFDLYAKIALYDLKKIVIPEKLTEILIIRDLQAISQTPQQLRIGRFLP